MSSTYTISRFDEVDQQPSDTPSEIRFSQKHDLVGVSSWDSSMYFYTASAPYKLRSKIETTAPLLTTAFMDDVCLAGDTFGNLFIIDLNTGTKNTLKLHESGLRHIRIFNNNLFITGSWDKTIKVFDLKSGQSVHQINLEERLYTLDCHSEYIAYTTAGNNIYKFDLQTQSKVQLQSKMNYQIKCLAAVDHESFMVGSIESKCELINFNFPDKGYAFRTHKTTTELHSVNAICVNPKNREIIVTGGGDGNIYYYNKSTRQRILTANMYTPITCMAFNQDGTVLGAGIGYDWSKGYQVSETKPNVKFIKKDDI
ncbi:hypothetical protein EDEG_00163 [Edhazardia aedis USNM 41457]|uniref:Uncharacterized protein n=1 Tax=Edhazardia aedis (strain USNM 41457) TaxID=1003232 RepID=J8ZVN6_EDHAE|nr:hypothetical protein EDEG_00163 [Edhazardia aedis USNM 41457]|eukprot:EJW03723.1 hypothetical protein EDEG_00163 [Edhazardia aedis USNM 41457]